MTFSVTTPDDHTVITQFRCDCGCTPAITYQRGQAARTKGCCCGTRFAVGADLGLYDQPSAPDRQERTFLAPWGERLETTWNRGGSEPPVA